MLRKLGELSQHNVSLSQNYNINSDYKTMKFEYDLHTGIRSKKNAVKWMSNMMIGIVQGIEMLNDNFNPFDLKFRDSWSNSVKNDVEEYYDVVGEIYEKYSRPGKSMAPELKLFLMLTGAAAGIQYHKIKETFSGSSHELDEDPQMIQKLRKQAEQSKNMTAIEKEHTQAAQSAAKIQMVNDAKNEYSHIQQMASNTQQMNNINRGLTLTDTARSVGSRNSKQEHDRQQHNRQQQQFQQEQKLRQEMHDAFVKQAQENKKREELLMQTKKLMEMNKTIQEMNKDAETDTHTNKKKQLPILKGLESRGSTPQNKSSQQKHNSPAKKKPEQDSDSDDQSSSLSSVSSKSSIAIHPNLASILPPKKPNSPTPQAKKNVSESSKPVKPEKPKQIKKKNNSDNDSSSSSLQSSKSKSSKSSGSSKNKSLGESSEESLNEIKLNIDKKLKRDGRSLYDDITIGSKNSSDSGSTRTGRGRGIKNARSRSIKIGSDH